MGPNRTGVDQFQLRLPSGLRERIKSHAEAHGRSMNTEIVRLLEDAFISESYAETMEQLAVEKQLQRKADNAASIDARLSAIEEKLDQLVERLGK
ncbi:Arc family DNA-binding protein [Rhizobium ruizarguesonis]|uniref:Arc family DNA-binding protein n=1 Tax=Rhizobium ruizarguesonis TaxID=2081791 RepID=UPI0018D51D06|nr:Arc family DNA-binding protein [Rhizobium ruizarguesonis]